MVGIFRTFYKISIYVFLYNLKCSASNLLFLLNILIIFFESQQIESTCEGQAGEAPISPLQFPLLLNINLHNFTFLFVARGSEKRDDHSRSNDTMNYAVFVYSLNNRGWA